jgi:hypothetical protein
MTHGIPYGLPESSHFCQSLYCLTPSSWAQPKQGSTRRPTNNLTMSAGHASFFSGAVLLSFVESMERI